MRSYSRAVELDPKSVNASVGLASAKWAAGMRAQAETEFEALIKQHPRDAKVYETYGTLLLSGLPASDTMETRAAALLNKAIAAGQLACRAALSARNVASEAK